MKKIIATIAASVLSVAAMAQKPGDGVLRIHTTDGEVTPIFTKNIKSMTFEEVTPLTMNIDVEETGTDYILVDFPMPEGCSHWLMYVGDEELVGDDRDGARVGIETDEEASVRQVAHHHLLLFVADEQQRQVAVPQPVEKALHPPGGLGGGRAAEKVVRAEHDAEAVRREPRGNLPQKYAHREIRNGNLAAVFAEVFDLPRIAKEGRPSHALGIAAAAERARVVAPRVGVADADNSFRHGKSRPVYIRIKQNTPGAGVSVCR